MQLEPTITVYTPALTLCSWAYAT